MLIKSNFNSRRLIHAKECDDVTFKPLSYVTVCIYKFENTNILPKIKHDCFFYIYTENVSIIFIAIQKNWTFSY